MKKQLNVRVSEYTRTQLAELVRRTGLSEAGVVTLAIDRLAQQLGVQAGCVSASGEKPEDDESAAG